MMGSGRSHRVEVRQGRGMTLVEILVAVGIMVLLASVAVIVAHGALGRAKGTHTQQTMELVNNVLTLYEGDQKHYPRDPENKNKNPDNGLELKSDSYNAEEIEFESSYLDDPKDEWPNKHPAFGEFAEHVSVMMYLGECKQVLTRLEGKALARRPATDDDKRDVWIVTDSWGHELLYRRFEMENNGFPILLSAGPDGVFDTDDDIRSDGMGAKE